MKIRPYQHRILVRTLPDNDKMGNLKILYKPESAHEDAIGFGIVEALGTHAITKKGVLVPLERYVDDLKVGDKIVFIKFLREVHTNVEASKVIGEDLILIDARKDILGVVHG